MADRIKMPNGWAPRGYQRAAWDFLQTGGRYCVLVWARQNGKDALALNHAACRMVDEPTTVLL